MCRKTPMEILSRLFGSKVRVKIIRLFLLNSDQVYEPREVAVLSRGRDREVVREILGLAKAGLIKRKSFYKDIGKARLRSVGWILDPSFIYLIPLRNLLVNSVLVRGPDMIKRLQRAGNLKFIVLSGIFVQQWDSRIDLLVVGERLKRGLLERILHSIESEIGKELRFTFLETNDFRYRLGIRDKLVRDVFDYPHQVILDKLGLKP